MRLDVDKHWAELLMVMTEDENGRIRTTEENELMKLPIVDFFIRLRIFQERMNKRTEEINALKNKK